MTTRRKAEAAIGRWRGDLGLRQKELALRVGVRETTISHILNEPGWTASADVCQRICDVVESEAASRIASIPLELISLCQSGTISFQEATDPVLDEVRSALTNLAAGKPIELPPGINGALIQVGPKSSGIRIIAVSGRNDNEMKRALAHELEHMRNEILLDIESELEMETKIPRSSF